MTARFLPIRVIRKTFCSFFAPVAALALTARSNVETHPQFHNPTWTRLSSQRDRNSPPGKLPYREIPTQQSLHRFKRQTNSSCEGVLHRPSTASFERGYSEALGDWWHCIHKGERLLISPSIAAWWQSLIAKGSAAPMTAGDKGAILL